MKKLLIKLGIALLSVGSLFAQQDQQYTQYMANQFTINPAVAGTEDFIDIKAGFRQQWVGFDAAPRTMYLTAHSTLGKSFNSAHGHRKGEHGYWHGIGAYFYGDKTGPISRNAFYGTYAFNTAIAKKVRLSLGMAFGIKQFNFDPNEYRENIVDGNDLLIEGSYTEILPDLNVGFWLYNKDFYFGASAYQILQSEVSFDGIYDDQHNGNFGKLHNHYFVTGGIIMPLSQELTFVPSFMLKYVTPSPASVDINGKLMYNDILWGGLSYRVGDAFSVIVGTVLFKHLEVSYSYDLTSSDIRRFTSGSHEVIVGYRLNHPSKLACPTNYWNKRKW